MKPRLSQAIDLGTNPNACVELAKANDAPDLSLPDRLQTGGGRTHTGYDEGVGFRSESGETVFNRALERIRLCRVGHDDGHRVSGRRLTPRRQPDGSDAQDEYVDVRHRHGARR